jgi:hypothetical protein
MESFDRQESLSSADEDDDSSNEPMRVEKAFSTKVDPPDAGTRVLPNFVQFDARAANVVNSDTRAAKPRPKDVSILPRSSEFSQFVTIDENYASKASMDEPTSDASPSCKRTTGCLWKRKQKGDSPFPPQLIKCKADGCSSYYHRECYELSFGKKNYTLVPETDVVCSKRHYTMVYLQPKRFTWSNDCPTPGGDTSEILLLRWFMEEGNFRKYRGNKEGKKKLQLASKLAERINAGGVLVVRNGQQVMNKIAHIEAAFKRAHDFSTTVTGAGIKEKDGQIKFDQALEKKCPNYFDLLPIMGDRAAAVPHVTNENNIDYSDEEDARVSDKEDEVSCDSIVSKKQRSRTPTPTPRTLNDSHGKRKSSSLESTVSKKKAKIPDKAEEESYMNDIVQQKLVKEKEATKVEVQRVEEAAQRALAATSETKMSMIRDFQRLRSECPYLSKADIIEMNPAMATIANVMMKDE